MTDTNAYFGRPGALSTLILPRGGVQAARIRQRSTFQLGTGGVRTQQTVVGKRKYTLSYTMLDRADFHTLLAFDQGHQGPGPFAFLDPGQRNLLTANQSAATSATNSTDDFTVAGTGGSIASSATLVHGSTPKALRWSFASTSPASAVLSLAAPCADFYGVPCLARAHTFSVWIRGGGTDAVMTVGAKIDPLDSTGASLGATTGSTAASSSGAWTQITVTVTPGSTAAYLALSIVVTGASVTNGSILYLSDFLLNEGSTPDTVWTPGTGVPAVACWQLDDKWPWPDPAYREAATFVLQEVGA